MTYVSITWLLYDITAFKNGHGGHKFGMYVHIGLTIYVTWFTMLHGLLFTVHGRWLASMLAWRCAISLHVWNIDCWLGTTKKLLNGHKILFLVRGWGLGMRLGCAVEVLYQLVWIWSYENAAHCMLVLHKQTHIPATRLVWTAVHSQ